MVSRRCTVSPAPSPLQRHGGRLAALALLLLLVSTNVLAAYNVWTSQYTFTRQELQTGLTAYFPRDLQYLDLVNIRLTNPVLELDGTRNRVVTRVNALVTSPVLLAAPMKGVLVVSSGLKYDATSRSVRLDRPRLERMEVAGLPADQTAQMNLIGNAVAEQFLADYPLYSFSPEQLRLNGRGFEPRTITVSADSLVVDIVQVP